MKLKPSYIERFIDNCCNEDVPITFLGITYFPYREDYVPMIAALFRYKRFLRDGSIIDLGIWG